MNFIFLFYRKFFYRYNLFILMSANVFNSSILDYLFFFWISLLIYD